MGIADFNFKGIESFKADFQNLKIGLNKDQTQINIDSIDQSTQLHLHSSIGLPPDVILKLSSQDLGDYIKLQTILQLKAVNQDNPKLFTKLMGTFNMVALTTGTATLVAAASIPALTGEPSSSASSESLSSSPSSSSIGSIVPISSGNFVDQLPKIIAKDIKITSQKSTQ